MEAHDVMHARQNSCTLRNEDEKKENAMIDKVGTCRYAEVKSRQKLGKR